MTEVIPGIYRFQLPMISTHQLGVASANAYAVRGTGGYLLVDTGWNTVEAFDALQKGLADIGADFGQISQIVVTHIHPDHYGMAGRVKKLSGASLAMHHIEKDFINSRYVAMDSLLSQTNRLLAANGVPPEMTEDLTRASVGLEQFVVPAPPDITLHDGDTIATGLFTFKVLWTPGHASGHICLYDPEKKIFLSGDHILPAITPNIGVHPQAIENPLGRYFNSLAELEKLDVALVLPGHDKPFTNFKERIERTRQHHMERNGEILEAMGAVPRTCFQIAEAIRWGKRGKWGLLPDFHKRMAVLETLSHLQMMATLGQVDLMPRKEIIYFRRVSPPR